MGTIAMKRRIPLPVALAAWATFAGSAASQAPLQWHFESSGGVPVKLVWQSETGRSYDLFQSPDLTGWVHVDGFPKPGTGGAMEHPFAAGTRGYFRIVSEPAAGDGMVLIPAGGFLMGDPSDPPVGSSAELPVHTVHVSAFYMAACEVTKALWNEVAAWAEANGYDIGVASAYGKAPDHPVCRVTWHECVKWCNARSEKELLTPCYTVAGAAYRSGFHVPDCDWNADGYRLPTEAEWEKAARGGLAGLNFPWGDTISHDEANYCCFSMDGVTNSYPYDVAFRPDGWNYYYHPLYYDYSSDYSTSPVGSFAPNGYGLCDMAGNLSEWCWDWQSASYYASSPATDPRGPDSGTIWRIQRGGNWSDHADQCRASSRAPGYVGADDTGGRNLGFRPARSAAP